MLPEETTVIYYYKKAMLDFKVEKEIVKLEINDEVQTEFSNKKLVEAKICAGRAAIKSKIPVSPPWCSPKVS